MLLIEDKYVPWLCTQCNAEWQRDGKAICAVCEATNDMTSHRVQFDLGTKYSPAVICKRYTGIDIDTRDMVTPAILMAVATYHLATNKATAIHDTDIRKNTILNAQQDFEQTCSEVATALLILDLQEEDSHYEWDHRGIWNQSPAGNFATPAVPNPWSMWAVLATEPNPTTAAEPGKPHSHQPEETPLDTPPETCVPKPEEEPAASLGPQAVVRSSPPPLPATSKAPPGGLNPWNRPVEESRRDEPYAQDLSQQHPPGLEIATRNRGRQHKGKGGSKGRSAPSHSEHHWRPRYIPRPVDPPHPPIGNRAGTEWGHPPTPCHCYLWEDWLKLASPKAVKDIETLVCNDGSVITCKEHQQTYCSFWKSGRSMEFDFHNGVVHRILKIHNANSPADYIVAVNTQLLLRSEGLHYVGRLGVTGPPFDRHTMDRSQAQAYQSWRATQDPNE